MRAEVTGTKNTVINCIPPTILYRGDNYILQRSLLVNPHRQNTAYHPSIRALIFHSENASLSTFSLSLPYQPPIKFIMNKKQKCISFKHKIHWVGSVVTPSHASMFFLYLHKYSLSYPSAGFSFSEQHQISLTLTTIQSLCVQIRKVLSFAHVGRREIKAHCLA